MNVGVSGTFGQEGGGGGQLVIFTSQHFGGWPLDSSQLMLAFFKGEQQTGLQEFWGKNSTDLNQLLERVNYTKHDYYSFTKLENYVLELFQ